MALWQLSSGTFYLPPQKPVPRVLNTDEYIQRTNLYFHGGSDRLFTVGHPYFEVVDTSNNVTIPKVSGNQYRVFRLHFPDPNKMALVEKSIYNPETERLVWGLRGIDISRGGPLGVGVSGHPLFNKYADAENPFQYTDPQKDDNRLNVAMEPKQSQMFIIGCAPALGGHWDASSATCSSKPRQKGDCPLLEYVNTVIEDGDMADTGYGALNFLALSEDRAGAPLDLINTISKYPDFIKMTKDTYGDRLFFFGNKEQLYTRHIGTRAGSIVDALPEHGETYLTPADGIPQHDIGSHIYFTTPSGSLVSTDGQIFNKPYWLQRAQGPNNGICWGNQLFVTVLDNTRNTNYNISVYKEAEDMSDEYKYKASDFRVYTRHSEEYEIEVILQLCKVPLNADVLAHINVMNPKILEEWSLAFVPPPPQGIESSYRYPGNLATRCPLPESEEKTEDPYKDLKFWDIDMTEKLTNELSQVPLGRRFLYQIGMLNGKRYYSASSVTKRTVKRKKTRA